MGDRVPLKGSALEAATCSARDMVAVVSSFGVRTRPQDGHTLPLPCLQRACAYHRSGSTMRWTRGEERFSEGKRKSRETRNKTELDRGVVA